MSGVIRRQGGSDIWEQTPPTFPVGALRGLERAARVKSWEQERSLPLTTGVWSVWKSASVRAFSQVLWFSITDGATLLRSQREGRARSCLLAHPKQEVGD